MFIFGSNNQIWHMWPLIITNTDIGHTSYDLLTPNQLMAAINIQYSYMSANDSLVHMMLGCILILSGVPN